MKHTNKRTELVKAIKRNARKVQVPQGNTFNSKRRDRRALLEKAHKADWS